ncbi:unnamed protein product [Caenorhabditis angaria]|uniref:Uncharacterized protein n=1 Tax=Caenorhabditis angaria TaxID=860376 RepID=A0A9P1I7D0_9PELO|nr:unnamed protein product [Caenorhabditis angaria]
MSDFSFLSSDSESEESQIQPRKSVRLENLDSVREYHGRQMLEMSTLSIDSRADGSRKIDFHFPKTQDELEITTFKIAANSSLKRKLNFINPEWFSMSDCLRTIQEIDQIWLIQRKRILLNVKNNNYLTFLPYFYAANYLIINYDNNDCEEETMKLSKILDEMPNLENLVLNGAKTECDDEDLKRFSKMARNVRSFSLDLSENSTVSHKGLVSFIESTNFGDSARVHIFGFPTTKKSMISAFLDAKNIENFVFVKKEVRIQRRDGYFVTLQFDDIVRNL